MVIPFLWRKCGLFEDTAIQATIALSPQAPPALELNLEEEESIPQGVSQADRRDNVSSGLEGRKIVEQNVVQNVDSSPIDVTMKKDLPYSPRKK